MNREQYLQTVRTKIGRRRLVFFGTRGCDAETLLEFDQLSHVISQVAPLHSVAVKEVCLETLTGERVDLNIYNIDQDKRDVIAELRAHMLDAFRDPAVVIPYRSSALLASAWFPRAAHVLHAGIFHETQASFDHKPWVETSLARHHVRIVPWRYVADTDADPLLGEYLNRECPLVLRASRSDGGAGITLIEDSAQLAANIPTHSDGFFGVAPFLSPSIPLNVNACIFRSGKISMHPASLQLIGPPQCTTRRFGYCGNDFASVKQLDRAQLDELDTMVRIVGKWLYANGYLGAFGIDALLYQGQVYLTEVNPRFQGSTLVASLLDAELGRPDTYTAHLAAFLDMDPFDALTLTELTMAQPDKAHVVVHNTTGTPIQIGSEHRTPGMRCRLVPHAGITVQPEAIAFQAVFPEAITTDGFTMTVPCAQQLEAQISARYRVLV